MTMKKLLLICTLLSLSITCSFAQTDFRKGSWGDSKADIVKKEAIKSLVDEPDVYCFEGSIGGKECVVAYAFTDDKLFRGGYILSSRYSDGKEYIRDYDYFKELLVMKYGKPDEDEKIWIKSTWENNLDYYSLALTMGDVSYSTLWTTDTTAINLSMATESSKVIIKIFYSGVELSEKHQAKILEDL